MTQIKNKSKVLFPFLYCYFYEEKKGENLRICVKLLFLTIVFYLEKIFK